jgi:MoaA/NifB/PqqE/SkfB family radical SAM enzyme
VRLKDQFRALADVRRDASGRFAFLVNDMVIEEQLCQMRCAYCLTEEFNLLMNVPDARLRLTTDSRADWTAVLDAYHAQVDAPVLRLSGGEFFWLRGSTEFVQECSARYETVQVITNGVFLDSKRIAALATVPNLVLNISLDGHTPEMNRHRFGTQQGKLFDVVLAGLERSVEAGIPTEIQCVLTDANVEGQYQFAAWLRERYDGKVMLFAFPVRGNETDAFTPPPGRYFDRLLAEYDAFAGVLPPRAFVEHIGEQVASGRRTLPCAVTGMMAQLFGTGELSACPHAWIKPIGNVTDLDLLDREFGRHQHYDLFMQPRPRFSFCGTCATPSDVVNLYLLGRVSAEEIARVPIYAGERTRARLAEFAAAYGGLLAGEPVASGR